MKNFHKYLSTSLLLTTVWIAGCGEPQAITEPNIDVAVQAARNGPGPQHPVPGAEVLEMLGTALQGEYYLEAMYARVLTDLGAVKPFTRVVEAEGRHIRALEKRYDKYQLPVPPSDWNADNVPVFDEVLEACAEAIRAEGENVAMYDAFLATELPANLASVFESLREASAENHVAAFTRCK